MKKFNHRILLLFIFIFYLFDSCAFANNIPEEMTWDKVPIGITLPIGKERLITFPGKIQFGYNLHTLPQSVLRVQNNGGTLYLLANQAFSPERVQVKLEETGEIIFLDLSAAQGSSATPINVILQKTVEMNHTVESTNTIDYVTLTRFAIRQLYSPERLMLSAPNISRVPMHTKPMIPLILNGSVISSPLGSWKGGELYVTAILIKNQTIQPIALDPNHLCGFWKSASFYPRERLMPRGYRGDTTTVFLTSTEPFSMAEEVCEPRGEYKHAA